MTNEEKVKTIHPWIDPEERVTVHFLDEQGLNAEVTGCTTELVDLSSKLVCLMSHNASRCRLVAQKCLTICPTIPGIRIDR